MLVAGQNTAAPPVTCPLDRKGWHAIYFGIRSYGYNEDNTRLLVRLKTDTAFSLISHRSDPSRRYRVDDVFWKETDLTGQDIVMGQWTSRVVPDSPDSVGNPSHGAWVAYIKLVPLSEEEGQACQAGAGGREEPPALGPQRCLELPLRLSARQRGRHPA